MWIGDKQAHNTSHYIQLYECVWCGRMAVLQHNNNGDGDDDEDDDDSSNSSKS